MKLRRMTVGCALMVCGISTQMGGAAKGRREVIMRSGTRPVLVESVPGTAGARGMPARQGTPSPAPVGVVSEQDPKPYSGEEKREIKALSADDVQGYLEGRGLGLAKAAELNHHPGPRHVLDLASGLNLSPQQQANTQKVYNEMHGEAVRLGKLIVDREAELDQAFGAANLDARRLEALVSEIALLQGRLRFTHLRAHLETRALLSAAQVSKYDSLRGYGKPAEPGGNPHRHE